MLTLQICDFVHDYYTCALCVYTNAVCPVMHMSVSCPCVCRKRAGLCAAVLGGSSWTLSGRPSLGSPLKCSLRSGDMSTFTNLRMILQIHLYSWYFLIIPDPCYLFLLPSDYSLLLLSFTGTHCCFFFFSVHSFYIALPLSFLLPFVCSPFSVVLHLFSALLTSPSLPPLPIPLSS